VATYRRGDEMRKDIFATRLHFQVDRDEVKGEKNNIAINVFLDEWGQDTFLRISIVGTDDIAEFTLDEIIEMAKSRIAASK
jgi:hypothetical protein